MTFSVRRYRSTFTSPDGTRVLQFTAVNTMGESGAFMILKTSEGEELLRLIDEAAKAVPGRGGKVIVTDEDTLRIRSTSTGETLYPVDYYYDRYLIGPNDRYFLTCADVAPAVLLDLETGKKWEHPAGGSGAFDQAGTRVLLVPTDRKKLSVHHITAPELDWEVSLDVPTPFGLYESAFFSSCGEFIGVRDDEYVKAVTRAFRADTGAAVSPEGIEFPLEGQRLAAKSTPDWPPTTVVEPWGRA